MSSVASLATSSRIADIKPVYDNPALKKVVAAIHDLDRKSFASQAVIGQGVAKLLQTCSEPDLKKLLWNSVRKKQQSVEKFMRWGKLYPVLPNDALWQAVGYDGVLMISNASKENQKKVIRLVLEHQRMLAADPANNSALVGACFVSTQLTRLGEVAAAKTLSCTKKAKKVKQKAKAASGLAKEVKQALVDLKAVLLRVPSFAGEFKPNTLTLLKTI
jgi:hypothetical protein